MGIKHRTQAVTPNNPSKRVSSNAWNEEHLVESLDLVGVTADPSSPAEGQIWFRSDLAQIRGYSRGQVVILSDSAQDRIEAAVTSTATGLSSTTEGKVFAVVADGAVNLYRNQGGAAVFLRSGVGRAGIGITNQAPEAAAIMTLAQADKTKRLPVKGLLGKNHNYGNDASTFLNARLADLASGGFTIIDPDAVGWAQTAPLNIGNDFRFELSARSGIVRKFGSALPLIRNNGALSTTNLARNFHMSGGVLVCEQDSFGGHMLVLGIEDGVIDRVRIENYRPMPGGGGHAMRLWGNRNLVTRFDIRAYTLATGMAGMRWLWGRNNTIADGYIRSGDDAIQICGAFDDSGSVFFNEPAEDFLFSNIQVETGCKAVIFGMTSSLGDVTGSRATIKRATARGIRGSYGTIGILVANDSGSSTMDGQVTDIVLEDIMLTKGNGVASGAPAVSGNGLSIIAKWEGAVRKVSLGNVVIDGTLYDGSTNGGTINGPGIQVHRTGPVELRGKVRGLRMTGGAMEVDIAGTFAANGAGSDGDEDDRHIVQIDGSAAGSILRMGPSKIIGVNTPTIPTTGLVTPMSGLFVGNGSRAEVGDLNVAKANAAAAGTKAFIAGTGASIIHGKLTTTCDVVSTGAGDVRRDVSKFPAYGAATIAAGAIALPEAATITIDTEGAAATDDLETITPPTWLRPGMSITLKTANNGRDVTVKHGTGNIRLTAAADAVLTTTSSRVMLQWDGVWWNQFGASFTLAPESIFDIIGHDNMSIGVTTNGGQNRFQGPLGRDMTVTLNNVGAGRGMVMDFLRLAAGSYSIILKAASGATLWTSTAANQWAQAQHDGTGWYLKASGTNQAPSGGAASAPAKVTGLTAITGTNPGEIVLNWTTPADGGSAITGYHILYRTGAGTWTPLDVGVTNSRTITGTPGASYESTVAAINAVSTGEASDPATAVAKAAASYSVAISGLTANPTYGLTPQYGTTLTAAVTGLTGSETVTYEWREGTVSRATGSSLALTAGGDFGDGQTLTLVAIINGTEHASPSYTIRHAPPTGIASLADVTGTEGDANVTINVAAVFSGSALEYRCDTNSIGASIDAVTGQATQQFNAPFAATTVVYRARNSGGEATRAHTVTCNAIVLGDLSYQATQLLASTGAAASVSGTLPTYADATGTLIYVTCNADLPFNVMIGGVNAPLVAKHSSRKNAGADFRTGCSVFYAPVGNGSWSVARTDGTATMSVHIEAIQVKGGTLRNFRPVIYNTNGGSVINASLDQAWRGKDLLLSSILNDQSASKLPSGGFAQLFTITQGAGSVENDVDHLIQAADGSATFTYNSSVSKSSFGWMILDCSQYPAVVARPAEPPTSGYLYSLDLARATTRIPVSGTYSGLVADIYERVVNEDGLEIVPWTLIQSAAMGNAYSGFLDVPVAGLKTLYREARKGTDAFSIKRQLSGFLVGGTVAETGQSNGSAFATGRQNAPTRHPKTMVLAAHGSSTGFRSGTQTGNGAIAMLNELVALSGIPWALVHGNEGGSPINGMAPGSTCFTNMAAALTGMTGKLHAVVVDQGEGDASANTQRTAAEWMDLVNQIHEGYATIRGQTTADMPLVYCSISTYGKPDDPYNTDAKWGGFRESQKAAAALAPRKIMLNRINMVRSTASGSPADPYHADPRSMEAYGRLLARTIWKEISGIGTLPVFKIATATRVDASTIDLTFTNSLSADWKVQRLPHGEATGYPIDVTTGAQGFAVTADGWATSIPCTVTKTGTNTARLTQATPNAGANTLSHAFGMQGYLGVDPKTITEGLLVEVSAEGYPLMFERNFPVF